MKLKDTFMAQDVDDTQFLIPLEAEGFQGIVRSNRTAAFIVDCLKTETSEERIVDAMCKTYGAPRDTVTADVREILDILRSIHALEE